MGRGRTNFHNVAQTTLIEPVAANDTQFVLDSETNQRIPDGPVYLVIDRDSPATREYIYCDLERQGSTWRTSSLDNRYLKGSSIVQASAHTHDAGTEVKFVAVAQHFEDMWDHIEMIMPSGIIAAWSGSIENIPEGWVLCDGNNGTPDLRNRFQVGAGQAYSVGATGGAENVALSTAQMPVHTHSTPGHQHGVGTLQVAARGWSTQPGSHGHAATGTVVAGGPTGSGFTNNALNALVGNTASGGSSNTGQAGSGQGHENRPPYYALAFIMKV